MKLDIDETLITYRAPIKEATQRRTLQGEHAEAPSLLLQTLRKRAGMTQAAAAKVMGVERTSVVNMEARNQIVRFEYLDKLADFLGVELVLTIRQKHGTNREVTIPAEGS